MSFLQADAHHTVLDLVVTASQGTKNLTFLGWQLRARLVHLCFSEPATQTGRSPGVYTVVQSVREAGVRLDGSLMQPVLTPDTLLQTYFLPTLMLRSVINVIKVMTNLDSILKSRDITLPTKVHPVKAMIFLVVMYGCESWTTKKSET